MTTVGLIGLQTDRVTVKMGRHNSLGVKLQQSNNILIQVHCLVHRINFAASQASKDIDYLERYQGQINSIYWINSIPIEVCDMINGREIQQLMHGKVKQVVKPSSIRWLLEFKTMILTVGSRLFSSGPQP